MSMALSTAGVFSGAGAAGTQALSNIQNFALAGGLQAEREKWERERLAMHEQFAAERESRGYKHAEALQVGNQAFERGMAQEKTGRDITLEGQRLGAEGAQKAEDRAIDREKNATSERLKGRELDITEGHNKDWFQVYKEMAKAREMAAAKVGTGKGHDYEQGKIYGQFLQEQIKVIRDNMKLMDPKEQTEAQKQIDEMTDDLRDVLDLPQRKNKLSTQKPFVDPLKQTAAPGMLQTPAP